MTSTTARTGRILAGLLAGVLALGACSDPAAPTAPSGVDDADVAFAQQMIPHHQGALEMSEIALERAEDPRVRDLAERIEAGQGPEIDLLTGWLDEWGAEPADGGHGAMGHDGGEMAGSVSDDDLRDADGTAFDVMWLQAMIAHHEGAVEMARTELADGRDEDARDLARTITSTQREEIDEMRALVDELGG